MTLVSVTAGILLWVSAVAHAQIARPPASGTSRIDAGTAAARERKTVTPIVADVPPRIDGRLDDAVWRSAARITDFVQERPNEGAPATEQTEVFVAYDSQRIYIGVYAHYSDIDLIRANRADRDQTTNDDTVAITFDPFLDAQRGYSFSVNGYGVQADSLQGSTENGDISWNALYESAGLLVNDGWTAEMSIPIKSLRYPTRGPGETHRWGFQVQRVIQGKDESVVWSPVFANIVGFLPQMGLLQGMQNLSTARNLELLPTFTAVQVGKLSPGGAYTNDHAQEVGVNLKYGVTSNLTLDFTYNPDFSQIESDRPQIDINQRFPLFFAELRPFFLEGKEIFLVGTGPPAVMLHTRTIVDPQFGAKLSGKVGKTMVGLMVVNDEAPGKVDSPSDPAFGKTAQVVVGRAQYDLYKESFVGALVTDREFMSTHSRLVFVQSQLRFGQNYVTTAKYGESDHRDALGVQRNGHYLDLFFQKQGRRFYYWVAENDASPTFRNDLGFIPRSYRRTLSNVNYRWWPEKAVINWGPTFTYDRNHGWSGVLEDEIKSAALNFQFAKSVIASGTVSRNLERYLNQNFDKTRVAFSATVNTSRRALLKVDFSRGDEIRFIDTPFLGRTTVWGVAATLRPVTRLQSQFNVDTTRFMDPRTESEVFDVKIFYALTTYQFSERLLLRNIIETNTLNKTVGVNLLATYRVNAGTVFFLGYDDRYREGNMVNQTVFPTAAYQRTNRALFTKLQYLFRR